MKDTIQTDLETALENEISSFKSETDPKISIGHLKLATVISKLIRDEAAQQADELNRQERLTLDKEKLKLERSKFNWEKKKVTFEQQLEAQKLQLSVRQYDLEQEKLRFEMEKQLETRKSARLDAYTKWILAGVALVPALLSFAGGMMALKLEYHDMGRTPSSFKDFMRGVKN